MRDIIEDHSQSDHMTEEEKQNRWADQFKALSRWSNEKQRSYSFIDKNDVCGDGHGFERYVLSMYRNSFYRTEDKQKIIISDGEYHESSRLICNAYDLLALKMASQYYKKTKAMSSMDRDDFIAQARLCLSLALDQDAVDRGIAYSVILQKQIKSVMGDVIRKNFSAVAGGKTAEQKKFYSKGRKVTAQVKKEFPDMRPDDRDEIIAQRLDMGVDQLKNARSLMHVGVSLNTPLDNSDGGGLEYVDRLEDDNAPSGEAIVDKETGQNVSHAFLIAALDTLNEREKDILVSRKLVDDEDVPTLEVFADKYGISKERVRQIEVRAFGKVQESMDKQMKAKGLSPSDLLP